MNTPQDKVMLLEEVIRLYFRLFFHQYYDITMDHQLNIFTLCCVHGKLELLNHQEHNHIPDKQLLTI